MKTSIAILSASILAFLCQPAVAQTTAYGAPARSTALSLTSSTAGYEDGYDDARSTVSGTFNPSTRDANNNRVIVNGIIQTGSTYSSGAGSYSSGASASAVGNLVNVQVTGSWNTVVLNSTQTNTAQVTATNTLNGKTTASAVLN